MLGQPVTMLIPQVIGFRLNGSLPPGTTATDLVLTVTQMLRKKASSTNLSNSSAMAWQTCHWPTVPRLQHVARVWQHLRDLSDR